MFDSNLVQLKTTVLPILKQYGVTKAGVFGSFLRDDFNESSDLDLLIELDKKKSLLYVINLKLKLEETLGRKVDLVEYDTIKPMLKNEILSNEERII